MTSGVNPKPSPTSDDEFFKRFHVNPYQMSQQEVGIEGEEGDHSLPSVPTIFLYLNW